MKARLSGLLAVPAALLLFGCLEDPVSDIDGSAAAIITSATSFQLAEGDEVAFTASVVDGRAIPLEVPVTFAACDADVAVELDTSYHPVPAVSFRANVTALTAGASCITASGGGFSATVGATVLPVSFSGALSSTTPSGGSILSIQSTPLLKFDPALVSVTFGGNIAAPIEFKSADSIRVLVPFSDAGPLTIGGIDVTYVPGLRVSLPTALSVTQTGDTYGLADTSFATAPTITLPAGAGQSVRIISDIGPANNTQCMEVVAGFGSTGPCMIYKFTVADSTALTFSSDWAPGTAGNPDVDIYSCSSPAPTFPTSCPEDSGSGATGAKPQAFTFTFPAGTHYFVIEIFAGSGARNITTTITQN